MNICCCYRQVLAADRDYSTFNEAGASGMETVRRAVRLMLLD